MRGRGRQRCEREERERDVLSVPWILCLQNVYASLRLEFMLTCVQRLEQRTLTYFVRGNITVWLTSCLTGLDSAVLLN